MSAEVSDVKGVAGRGVSGKSGSGLKWAGGTISGLACKCLEDESADFLIKEDRIVCACCGREVLCAPPLRGIFKATCECCISTKVKTTFVLDSKAAYTCTWCGRSR